MCQKKTLYRTSFLILFLLIMGTFSLYSQIKILPLSDIKYVNDKITLKSELADSTFTNYYWLQGDENGWITIGRTPPGKSIDWTIPYIWSDEIHIEAISQSKFKITEIWNNQSAHEGEQARVANFSPNLDYIVSCSPSEVKVWDIASQSHVETIDLSAIGNIRYAEFFHNKDTLIISTIDSVIIYDRINKQFEYISSPEINGNIRMAKSHSSKPWIAFGGLEGRLAFYDVYQKKMYAEFDLDESGQYQTDIYSLSFSSSGDSLVCGTYGGYNYIFNLKEKRLLKIIGSHKDEAGQSTPIFETSFSSDGSKIISCSADKTVRMWDINSSDSAAVYRGHTTFVQSADFLSGSKQFISASLDGSLLVWDSETLTIADSIIYGAAVQYSAISGDNTMLLASGRNGSFKLWRIEQPEYYAIDTAITAKYLIFAKYENISGRAGETASAHFLLRHDYDASLMPREEFRSRVYFNSLSDAFDITSPGEYNSYQIFGNVKTKTTTALEFLFLQGKEKSIELLPDSIIAEDMPVYEIIAEVSQIDVTPVCYSQKGRQIEVGAVSALKITKNNKTLHLDVTLIEDGTYFANIFDVTGKLVASSEKAFLKAGKHIIDMNVDKLLSGLYFIRITEPSGNVLTGQIVLEN